LVTLPPHALLLIAVRSTKTQMSDADVMIILMPGQTFVATATAALETGAVPGLVTPD
jgi:dTDP-4-amino-4,6-dideoxygalactose transaminase